MFKRLSMENTSVFQFQVDKGQQKVGKVCIESIFPDGEGNSSMFDTAQRPTRKLK